MKLFHNGIFWLFALLELENVSSILSCALLACYNLFALQYTDKEWSDSFITNSMALHIVAAP